MIKSLIHKEGNGEISMNRYVKILLFSILIVTIIIIVYSKINGMKEQVSAEVINKEGNSMGNLMNGGFVAKQGNLIIYDRDPLNAVLFFTGGLHRAEVDGAKSKRISLDIPRNINVVGDWIYYNASVGFSPSGFKLYKIKLDGSKKTTIGPNNEGLICVIDDKVYYYGNFNTEDVGKIFKMGTDGKNREKINDDDSSSANVMGDWIYYKNMSDGGKIYKIKTDGTGRVKICDDEVWELIAYNGYVYYTHFEDESKIYRIGADGTGNAKLSDDNTESINIYDDWIYYSNYDDNCALYKIRTDGTDRTKVSDVEIRNGMNIIDDWIYYYSSSTYGVTLCKIKIDGSEKVRVK
jgi:hypothetical protein